MPFILVIIILVLTAADIVWKTLDHDIKVCIITNRAVKQLSGEQYLIEKYRFTSNSNIKIAPLSDIGVQFEKYENIFVPIMPGVPRLNSFSKHDLISYDSEKLHFVFFNVDYSENFLKDVVAMDLDVFKLTPYQAVEKYAGIESGWYGCLFDTENTLNAIYARSIGTTPSRDSDILKLYKSDKYIVIRKYSSDGVLDKNIYVLFPAVGENASNSIGMLTIDPKTISDDEIMSSYLQGY